MANKPDSQLKLQSDQIKNETVINANTALRIGQMMEDLIDSKINNDQGPVASDHGALTGLADDDHTQYHNNARGDARYFQQTEFIDNSTGAPDGGKPTKTDSNGKLPVSFLDEFSGIGSSGIVPDPTAGTNTRVLQADGTWVEPAAGGGVTFFGYTFDNATADADPGSGEFRINNTDLSLGTELYASDNNSASADVSAILLDLKSGDKIGMQQQDDPTKQALYEVSGAPTDATTYVKVPVTFLSKGSGIGGGASFDNGQTVAWFIFEEAAALSGQDEVEVIPFDDDLDTVHEQSYLLPLQITDVPSPGISSLANAYSVKSDDGAAEYSDGPSEENVSIGTLNTNLDARADSTWVIIRTIPTVTRLSSIRRTKNMT